MRSIALLSLIVLVAFAAAPAVAQTLYLFDVSEGNWNEPDNWSPTGYPQAGDTAYIGYGKICHVTGDEACDHFMVWGALEIQAGHSLTITGNCSVPGSLQIRGDELSIAALTIADDLLIWGGGEIEMWYGVIEAAGGSHELTLKWLGVPHPVMRVHGDGEIMVALTNEVYVVGDHAGASLRLTQEPKQATYDELEDYRGSWMAAFGGQLSVDTDVTGTGRWHVEDGTIAINVSISVDGDVSVAPGTFLVNSEVHFNTTGKLEWAYTATADATIEVKAGGSATFWHPT